MKILVGFESSGVVREAFRNKGHEAYSLDLLDADDKSPYHLKMNIWDVINNRTIKGIDYWDIFILHPVCTYLCISGLHWNEQRPERAIKTQEAIVEFLKLTKALRHKVFAIENPIGCMSTHYRGADQIIQPYDFGEDASKATCLWLNKLPCLRPTEFIHPRIVDNKPRWGNQTDSGQNNLPETAGRWKARSKTYQGIAEAMAAQWNQNTIHPQPELFEGFDYD